MAAFWVVAGAYGCGRLAPIEPAAQAVRADTARQCRAHFLSRPWQMVQSMTAYLPGGDVRNAIAVLRIYPDSERIECVIMSLEGIVLFDGAHDGGLSVRRAVAPFDDPNFQKTLFSDIRLAFLPPAGADVRAGFLPDSTPICRYQSPDNSGYTELRLCGSSRPEIRYYTADKRLRKTVTLCYAPACTYPAHAGPGKIPARISVSHHGLFDYRLSLKLLRARPLDAKGVVPPG